MTLAVLGVYIFVRGTAAHAQAPPSCATLTVDGVPVCNTATVATHNQVHAGENVCILSAGACSLIGPNGGAVLKAYTFGMPLTVIPDVACASNQLCQVNVDRNGPITLKSIDGTTGVTMNAGYGYEFFYNAHGVFQLKAN